MKWNISDIFDLVHNFWDNIIQEKPKRINITISVTVYLSYILLSISLLFILPIIISILIITLGIFLVVQPIQSIAINNIKNCNAQSEEYRSDPKNKGKIFVNYPDLGWQEYSFGFDSSTQSFKKLVERTGLPYEMGGDDTLERKRRKQREDKLNNLLGKDDE